MEDRLKIPVDLLTVLHYNNRTVKREDKLMDYVKFAKQLEAIEWISKQDPHKIITVEVKLNGGGTEQWKFAVTNQYTFISKDGEHYSTFRFGGISGKLAMVGSIVSAIKQEVRHDIITDAIVVDVIDHPFTVEITSDSTYGWGVIRGIPEIVM